MTQIEFGWYPIDLDCEIDDISIATQDNLKAKKKIVHEDSGVYNDWIYAPPPNIIVIGSGSRNRPYASRVFGLPKTHILSHAKADGLRHLDFLVWALSFFLGIRLTTTEAGFLDATPIKPHKLTDFLLSPRAYGRALSHAEIFWQNNKNNPVRARRWIAAVHALFLAQYPRALQFEQFIYLYGALDACFALTRDLYPLSKKTIKHDLRISWMCSKFDITVPPWADNSTGKSPVSIIRNATIHETIFMDEPLGFALHGVGTNENLTAEMEALICRLLIALISDCQSKYVRTPVNTYQTHFWKP